MAGTKKEQGPSSERISANLRRIRQERGLSYAELARRVAALGHPVLDTGLMKIEKGTRRVDVDDLMALAVALETTPNRLLLPEVDIANPGERFALTPSHDKVRVDDAWAWAHGERPLNAKPASFAGEEPAAAELRFIAANRRQYSRGGFGWLGETNNWLQGGAQAGQADPDAKVKGSGFIAGAILGAFTKYGLNTRDIRRAAESAIAASLIAEEPDETERVLHEVWAWLMSFGDDEKDEGEGDEEVGQA